MRIDFRILGPLELSVGGRVLPLGSPKQRALLALLLLHANETISRDRLIEELWGDAAPVTVESAFHVYLSRLRRLLDSAGDGGVLVRHAHGYSLQIEPDQLDAQRFARLAGEGSEALAAGEAKLAADRLRQALALWRGPPLADLESERFVVAASARLDEERVSALEQRLEADLALGQHRELVAELETLVTEYPYRERLRGQLMLALYRAGRQAEALHAYQGARHTLVEELGIEPGQALRRLEQAILQQDGSLDLSGEPALRAEVATRETPVQTMRTLDAAETVVVGTRWRRRLSFGVAAVAAAGIAAFVALLVFRGGESITVHPNSVAVIDPKTNKLVADVPVGRGSGAIAFGGGSVWVPNVDDSTISRINPRTREVERTIPMQDVVASDIAAGGEGVWIADGPHNAVVRVSPNASRVVRKIPAGDCAGLDASIAYGKGGVWFVCAASLIRVDPTNNTPSGWDYLGGLPRGIAFGLGAVWVSNGDENTVSGINPQTKQITKTITVAGDPRGLAIGDGAVWVSAFRDDQVSRLAARPGEPITTESIPVGDGPIDVAVGAGGVWVANSRDGTVSRIDPRTRKVVATIPVGNSPRGIAVGADRIWVTVRAPEKAGLQR